MGSQIEKQIGEQIWEIAHKRDGGLRFPIMTGSVVAGSVDMDNLECTVLLSVDDEDSGGTEGILLNAVSLNSNGFLLFPADGSKVWVAELDGPGKWGVIKCSDLVKCQVTIGNNKTVVNGDNVEVTTGGNKLTMNADGVVVDANNITMKAAEIKIGAGDAFANHFVQYEALLSYLNALSALLVSLANKWNAFATAYVPGSPLITGLPASLRTSTVTVPGRGFDLSGAKLTHIKTD